MLTRENIKNRDSLSILGFGCMRFPTRRGSIDVDRSVALLRDAAAKGVNYFDTAYFYNGGKSEVLLGNALSGGLRDKVKIADKLPCFMVSKLDGAKKIFDTQLSRLSTDYIDYYLFHMLTDKASFDRMADIGVLDWMEELKSKGIIKNIGFSFHGSKTDFEQIVTAYPWDMCQIQYNYMDENNQATKSGLCLAYSLGIPVVIMEPLRGGKLAGSLPKEVISSYADCRKDWSPAEWALRWIWNHPEVTVVLSGMSDEAQLEENARIASDAYAGSLSQEELEVFDRVKKLLLEKTKVPCTGCGYCMPCPFGVNIPGCFSAYNDKFLLGGRINRFKYYQTLGFLSKQPAYASICRECGRCESHCPQGIKIRRELKAISQEMEGFFFRNGVKIYRKFKRI